MNTPKISLRVDRSHPEVTDVASRTDTKPILDPVKLLESLRAKQRLFAQLKNEGLIHLERHKTMEAELKKTIQDLESLIPLLEET